MTASVLAARNVSIQRVQPADFATVSRLLLGTNAEVTLEQLQADFRASWERWPSLQLGAYRGRELMGLIAGRVDSKDPTLGWSDDTVLVPSLQRQGVGGRLLKAQLETFARLGCTRVRGLSPEAHLEQLQFFIRHGFRVVAEEVAHGLWGVRDRERVFITEKSLS